MSNEFASDTFATFRLPDKYLDVFVHCHNDNAKWFAVLGEHRCMENTIVIRCTFMQFAVQHPARDEQAMLDRQLARFLIGQVGNHFPLPLQLQGSRP